MALLGLIAGACRPEHTEPSTIYLVAQRYQQAGDPSTMDVPTALVGGERRPVLANPAAVTLGTELQRSGPEDTVLRVHIPEAMRGKPLRLAATLPTCPDTVAGFDPRFVSKPGAVVLERVRLPEKGQSCSIEIAGRPPPERSYSTGPVEVPTGARLRFATGVEDEASSSQSSGVRFAVTAIDGETETLLVETRTDDGSRRWIDHDIDLSAYGGRTVRLRFDADATADSFAYPVWGDPTIVTKRPGPSPLNVLLISLDTLRADRLGCYGYDRPTSPTIDWKLAVQGTLFQRAYSQYPQTFGSHMTLLTGLYPCAHGLPGPKGAKRALSGDVDSLAELLRAAGYRTGAVTEGGYVNASVGFARGFGSFTEFMRLSREGFPAGMVAETFGNGARWIAREQDRPWFLFLHTYQVHEPYQPPPGYAERVVQQSGPFKPSDLYDGEIRYTDEKLADLLAFLDTSGLAEKTLLIVTSDHGEQFGERGQRGHGNSLYNVLLHVPLIMRAPGILPAGRRIGEVVGLIDVLPTVLDVLGLPAHAAAQGRSLAPLWNGHPLPARTLFAEEDAYVLLVAAFAPPYKWIFSTNGGATQAFDLMRDPNETRDLASALGDRGEPVLAEFRSMCAAGAREPTPAPPMDQSVREKLNAQLRALGYVE